MKRKRSEKSLWIGLGVETVLGIIACSAIFMSPIHWTLKLGFAATLTLVTFLLDSHDATAEWGRQLQTGMIATIAQRLDEGPPQTTEPRTLERLVDSVQAQAVEIMSGGGEAEWRIVVFQIRCGIWIASGVAFAYFLGPAILQKYP